MKLVIAGEPKALQRHRMRRIGNFVRSYDTAKNVAQKSLIRDCALYNKLVPTKPLTEPLELSLFFYMPIPKSRAKTTKENDFHIIKPDVDNMIKLVKDALNKVIYHDDSQIVRVVAEKRYSNKPRTEIILNTLIN